MEDSHFLGGAIRVHKGMLRRFCSKIMYMPMSKAESAKYYLIITPVFLLKRAPMTSSSIVPEIEALDKI